MSNKQIVEIMSRQMINSKKIEKGMTIEFNGQQHIVTDKRMTRVLLSGIGPNGRRSSTDRGSVYLTTDQGELKLSKRIKVVLIK